MPTLALTRAVSPTIGRCELTHLERQPIDFGRAVAQHASYEVALAGCGAEVHRLPDLPDLPDAVFVEDTVVVVDEVAVVTRPGAVSRRDETESTAEAIVGWRPVTRLEAPATLDGGDVLRIGRRVWVGRSGRTNREGLEQLALALRPYGYEVTGVEVHGCLHLKSAVSQVAERAVLVNPWWIDARVFEGLHVIEVDPDEEPAANAVSIGGKVVFPDAYDRTASRLEAEGLEVVRLDVSEFAKAEGAVSCCSVLFDA